MHGRAARGTLVYLSGIDFPHARARAIQIVNTCHALASLGWQVLLIAGRRESGPPEQALARYGLTPRPGLEIWALPVLRLPAWAPAPIQPLYSRLWAWSYVLWCLLLLPALMLRKPTAVLVRDYRLAWLLLRLRRLHRLRLVFEVHGLPSVELLDREPNGPQATRAAKRLRGLELEVFRGAWRLLAITECLRQRLLTDYGSPAERVVTVPDATSARLTDGHPELGVDVGRTNRPAQLIYVGQLYPWKGVDLLLEALARLERAELTIVGGLENDRDLPRLRMLAEQLGVAERVIFTGPRPYAEVPALLEQADVALLPLAEGVVARCFTSPLKLFDYMAAGRPIVAVDFPTIREVLRDGENGLLANPGDAGMLAAQVRRLLDDPELARRIGEQARRDAAAYTWQRRAERISAALDPTAPRSPTETRVASTGASR